MATTRSAVASSELDAHPIVQLHAPSPGQAETSSPVPTSGGATGVEATGLLRVASPCTHARLSIRDLTDVRSGGQTGRTMRKHCDDTSADQAVGLDCAPGVPAARHASHDHAVRAGADQRYLGIALGLIVAFMLVEVVVAATSGSLALLADAGHMLTDAGALAGAIWAARLASRPAQGAWTFGLKRAEILSAAVNGVTLLAVALLIGNEAIDRLLHPVPVEGAAMLAVAGLGIVVNVAATLFLARANRSSLNIEGASNTSSPTPSPSSRR